MTRPEVAPLLSLLQREIRHRGPLSVEEYMALCLGHPRFGYYTQRNPFGTDGDFVTAPEVSQLFGEMIGIFCAEFWLDNGRPRPFQLVELGPGRGSLLADLLRIVGVVPGFAEAMELHLVETSSVLRDYQQRSLNGYPVQPTWHDSVDSLPDLPLIVVANEFLDAIPIRQYVRTESAWHVRRVGLDADGGLIWDQTDSVNGCELRRVMALEDAYGSGDIVEFSPQREQLVARLAARIARLGGCLLAIDYGYVGPKFGDSLQAVGRHRYEDVLAAPGEQDITAHVDFGSLISACANQDVHCFGPISQGDFLLGLGIATRAAQIKQSAVSQRAHVEAGLQRLIHPAQMGTLFRAMVVSSAAAPPVPFAG